MRLLPVLFDFHLCAGAQAVNGVQVGGRGALLADPVKRERLISTSFGLSPSDTVSTREIAAWDLFNEPEWCTRPFAPAEGSGVMDFVADAGVPRPMTECLHAAARQPVTVGSTSAAQLDLVRGIGLDFYQVHWYEPFGWAALAEPVGPLRPRSAGSPGRVSGPRRDRHPGGHRSAARRAGYVGALIWSVASHDSASLDAAES